GDVVDDGDGGREVRRLDGAADAGGVSGPVGQLAEGGGQVVRVVERHRGLQPGDITRTSATSPCLYGWWGRELPSEHDHLEDDQSWGRVGVCDSGSWSRRKILRPSQVTGSNDRSTTRSLTGMMALSVILMPSGHTSVQHLVMLHSPMPARS